MCVPFYYMDTYKFVGKSYIPEDSVIYAINQ